MGPWRWQAIGLTPTWEVIVRPVWHVITRSCISVIDDILAYAPVSWSRSLRTSFLVTQLGTRTQCFATKESYLQFPSFKSPIFDELWDGNCWFEVKARGRLMKILRSHQPTTRNVCGLTQISAMRTLIGHSEMSHRLALPCANPLLWFCTRLSSVPYRLVSN